jgi:cytochrome c peroxidase
MLFDRSTGRSLMAVTVAGLAIGSIGARGSGCNGPRESGTVTSSNSQTHGPFKDAGATQMCPPAAATVPAESPLIAEGRQTFRFDTFGDEVFWGDTIKLHQAIMGATNGGIGDGVSPAAALQLGLKVDMDALPASVVDGIQNGAVDLNDPAATIALLRLNAVVGVTAFFESGDASPSSGPMKSMGIQCALCHSTVDDAFSPGIGHRLDGYSNRDLNVGAIVASAPDLSAVAKLLGVDQATVRTVLLAWGPGKFDAELLMDGKGFRPDGKTAATLIPPAFGLAGVNLHTWTGWGSVPYWNAFVAILEMHGTGSFFDPRLDDATKFPVAAKNRFGHIVVDEDHDRVTPKLPALHLYQMSLAAPTPPAGSFDTTAADRGDKLFAGKARCTSCHVEPLTTEPGWNLHTAAEIGVDDFQAQRSPDGRYRTAPLRGLFTHAKGGFYHDGRFATLLDVVNHYDALMALGLTDGEKSDVVEYLKSL